MEEELQELVKYSNYNIEKNVK